jgi:hypothetical protein
LNDCSLKSKEMYFYTGLVERFIKEFSIGRVNPKNTDEI